MRFLVNILIMLFLCGLLVICHTSVHAVPPIPSSFFGTVKVDDEDVPEGTTIQALINNQVFATITSQIYLGDSVYSLIVPGDDPNTSEVEGGKEGEIVSFKIGGEIADQTGTWNSGVNLNLDLTTSKGDPKASPIPTTTLTFTPTYIPHQTKTVTVKTFTPEPSIVSTATIQSTFSKTQTVSVIMAENCEDDECPSSSEGGSTPATEVFFQTKDPNFKETMDIDNKVSEPKLSKSPSSTESIESVRTINWLHFGIPAVILIGLGAGILYFGKGSKSDDLLL